MINKHILDCIVLPLLVYNLANTAAVVSLRSGIMAASACSVQMNHFVSNSSDPRSAPRLSLKDISSLALAQ